MQIQNIDIIKFNESTSKFINDAVAVEEPLEISIAYKQDSIYVYKIVAVTMRTPGDDEALAVGFLFTEQIINESHLIEKVVTKGENKICVYIQNELVLNMQHVERNFYTTSSCGVCGKASIESVMYKNITPKYPKRISVSIQTIYQLKDAIQNRQSNFESTGGIHAATLFDLEGNLLYLFEDVGRHNAVDKLIGNLFLNQEMNLSDNILLLSGRASFELIQKASVAQIPIVCALGAPSSLAVAMAEESDITLVGFLKNKTANVYTVSERITSI